MVIDYIDVIVKYVNKQIKGDTSKRTKKIVDKLNEWYINSLAKNREETLEEEIDWLD